jgi:hypothetical protein
LRLQVCYIERTERGMLPVRLRLVSARSDQTWSFPEVRADDREALVRGLREAAEWIAEQLREGGGAELGALVLDPDGARCGWVSAHVPESEAVGAIVRQAAEPISSEDDDGAAAHESPPHVALDPDVRIPGGVSFQPLTVGSPERGGRLGARAARGVAEGPRQRVGVSVVPDATVRLLLDELDARGVEVRRVVSVWHALAEAFTGERRVERAERVVEAEETTSAQTIVDPSTGRMLWAWSRRGMPIAAGAQRLERGAAGDRDAGGYVLTGSDLGRLAADWMAWSVQLGASPSRWRVLCPEGVWADEGGLGARVASVWPGATTDLVTEDDPLGLVLGRFAEAESERPGNGEAPGLGELQGRPGRPHRSMYRWAAAVVALAATGMGVAAWRVHDAGAEARRRADQARSEWRQIAQGLVPDINEGLLGLYDAQAMQELQARLEARRRAVAPLAISPEKPVMRELETLSFILSNPEYELRDLSLSELVVTITVDVPDTAAYEDLVTSLSRISGSSVRSWTPSPQTVGGRLRVTLTGDWDTSTRSGAGGA